MLLRMRFVIMALLLLAAPALAGAGGAVEHIIIATTGKGQPPEWPDYIANSKGFFAEYGVSVDLVATQSAAAATMQAAAGSAQMSVGGRHGRCPR